VLGVSVKPGLKWRLRHPVIALLARFGHWEQAHSFKTCPSGERHCPHMYWVRDRRS
jgi:hypothetical protein